MGKPTIGFIGLGLMGSAMVEQLQRGGYALRVIANRSRTAVDAAVARGADEVTGSRELAAHSDIVMLCVDTSESVESRMLGSGGDDGIIAGLGEGKVVIDFGTSLPDSTRKLGAAVAARGAHLLDSPIGRTPAQARQGKLNLMVSGDRGAFERVKAVLEVLGENVFYLGALGSGHTLKLINNFFTQTVIAAMGEAFIAAEAAGLDKQQVYDVIAAGPGHCPLMDFVKAYAIDGDRERLQFSIRNARKDVGYYAAMMEALGRPSAMSAGAEQLLGLATDNGFGERHVSELIDFLRESGGRA